MPGQAEAVTTASSSCIKPYLAANKTGLQATPASWMGQIGALQPLPGHPSWDGADNAQTGAYLASTDEMFVGGVAASYVHDGTSTAVHNLFAVKASTGALVTSFLPNVNGAVTGMTLSCDGTGLYIVGTFTQVNGQARNHAAEVSVANGQLLPWNPHPDGTPYDVAVVAGHVLVGGNFHHIGGAAHAYISAVNPTTGRAGNWVHVTISGPVNSGSVLVGRIIGSPDQSKIALLGNFLNANGTYHSRIAFLRVTTRAARLLPWATNYTKPTGYQGCNPNFGWKERDGMFSPDSQTFREAATGGYAKPGKYGTTYRSICDSVTAWDVSATALRN
ncbi:MAG TPA: hypothetical protein VFH39_03520, partial [Candidatus Saccharimonadales bacterium]|nr:hypothetical protein [Candidatus Saccharimonadales bacterium]